MVSKKSMQDYPMRKSITVLLLILTLMFVIAAYGSSTQKRQSAAKKYDGWERFGGSSENIHYSTLNQINKENVQSLQVAWTFDTGDAFAGSEMQCNPIIVDGLLYATTPKMRVIALNAETGALLWSFDANEGKKASGKMRNRGLTYWASGEDKRIYFVFKNFLQALDAKTGKPINSFGDAGRVDLREGLGRAAKEISITVSSPGVIYQDLLILGSLVGESLPSAPGHLRAYDVHTGKQRWIFHTIPQPGEYGYKTWPKDAWEYIGGANNWCGMVVDEKRGLLFAPTGSAAFDFYGANRHGDNLFANSLLCLNAATGKRVWHFQAVRHDLWDRDFPAAPALVTIKRQGRMIDAVAQITKSGHVYVFERATGKPLFPIEYRKVSTAGVDGEKLAEIQPLPRLPEPFARQTLTDEMLTKRTPEAHKVVAERFRKLRSRGQFEPPSLEGTIVFPGFDGGGEWGGAAFDPQTHLLYVNSNEMAWVLRLVEKAKAKTQTTAKNLYLNQCASCHGSDLRGTPPEFPTLVGISKKYNEPEISTIIRKGAGRMSGFARLGDEAIQALARFLLTGEDAAVSQLNASPIDLKYTIDGYNKFLDPEGYPAIEPPWGTLNAIDLSSGKIVWKIPFGEIPELAAKGITDTGSENYGGAIVTEGGLLFIGATNFDKKFHAYDKATGKLLWETVLPAAGNATPATYEINGRQFVVIAAGGGKSNAPSGGSYVAYALPKNAQ
jgi:quinoprotein glucose dehydrogenase